MSKARQFIKIARFLIGVVGAACTGPAIPPQSALPVHARPARASTTPEWLVARADVGSHQLQFICLGRGSPTVIIEDALGVSTLESAAWWPIMTEVRQTTRICAYDRAGLGYSDPPPAQPRTSQDVVNDLQALLTNGIGPGPYVIIGHAVGGLHGLLYASQFPSDIVGLVLVNSAHPDQWSRLRALLPPVAPDEPARLARLRAMPSQPADNPERLDLLASASQVRRALSGRPHPFDNVPLVVITRSPTAPIAPFLPPEIAGSGARVWQELQADLVGLSSNSTHVIAAEAGHNIHLTEPHLIVDAVRWIASELDDN